MIHVWAIGPVPVLSVAVVRITAIGAPLSRDGPDQSGALDTFKGELIELRAEFEPGDAETVEFNLRGATVIKTAAAPQRHGK